jgi:hypothetical protein
LEEAMVAVWRDTLVECKAEVELQGQKFAERETPRKRLREVDFVFEGQPLRGLEQNPKTESRWAQLGRQGQNDAVSFRRSLRGQRAGREGDDVRGEEKKGKIESRNRENWKEAEAGGASSAPTGREKRWR